MKKAFLFLLTSTAMLLIGSIPSRAQMRVGVTTSQSIHAGAALEIHSGPDANNNYRGLLLPRVSLTNSITWTLASAPTEGMLVFNTATTSGNYAVLPGVYCWYNFQWNRLTQPSTPTPIAAVDCLPNSPATGLYYASTALSVNNKKQISITPGGAGPYSVATKTVNGYSFSASGMFTAAQVGTPQTIVLQGSGTPQMGGLNTFTLTAETQSCTFSVNAVAYVACSGPLLGEYKVNQPLTASNTKQITIIPRVPGSHYFLSPVFAPDIASYFYFNKTVVFTADQVGLPQTVILEGSGTPKNAGTFSATVQVYPPNESNAIVGCSYTISILP